MRLYFLAFTIVFAIPMELLEKRQDSLDDVPAVTDFPVQESPIVTNNESDFPVDDKPVEPVQQDSAVEDGNSPTVQNPQEPAQPDQNSGVVTPVADSGILAFEQEQSGENSEVSAAGKSNAQAPIDNDAGNPINHNGNQNLGDNSQPESAPSNPAEKSRYSTDTATGTQIHPGSYDSPEQGRDYIGQDGHYEPSIPEVNPGSYDHEISYACDWKGRPKRIITRTVTFRRVYTRTRIRKFHLFCGKDGKIHRKMIATLKLVKTRTKSGQIIGGRRVRYTTKVFQNGNVRKSKQVLRKGKGRKH